MRIVHVEAPEAELLRRNRARAARVPEAVLERMIAGWEAHAVEWASRRVARRLRRG